MKYTNVDIPGNYATLVSMHTSYHFFEALGSRVAATFMTCAHKAREYCVMHLFQHMLYI